MRCTNALLSMAIFCSSELLFMTFAPIEDFTMKNYREMEKWFGTLVYQIKEPANTSVFFYDKKPLRIRTGAI